VRGSKLLKVLAVLAALTVLGFLFVRSARNTRAEAYRVPRAVLEAPWTLELDPAAGPGSPLLTWRPPHGLGRALFDQIFSRAMESLASPAAEGIPILLWNEHAPAFGGTVAPGALLAAARSAGLEGASLRPRCLGYRRTSDRSTTRQIYFVLFDAPEHLRFRQQLARMAAEAGGSLDPEAVSPILLIAGSDSAFTSWFPLRADPERDCVANIEPK
jgi:hypothetical protein